MVSMSAAAVLLYAVPHSPMAQPWPLLAGNLLSGLIGGACSLLFPDPVLAAAFAVGVSVLVMHLANCLHPPGAATAMAMAIEGERLYRYGWEWVASNLIANVLLALLLALTVNNVLSRGRYPLRHAAPTQKPEPARGEPSSDDIEWALAQMGSVVDVDKNDLLEIYRRASERARNRV
jgi:CBS-domain-containing membrane protein